MYEIDEDDICETPKRPRSQNISFDVSSESFESIKILKEITAGESFDLYLAGVYPDLDNVQNNSSAEQGFEAIDLLYMSTLLSVAVLNDFINSRAQYHVASIFSMALIKMSEMMAMPRKHQPNPSKYRKKRMGFGQSFSPSSNGNNVP